MRALWLLDLALRLVLSLHTQRLVFRRWLIWTTAGELLLYFINAMRWRCCYDYVWRTESLLALAGLALVAGEAVASERQALAAGPTGDPPPSIGGPVVSAVIALLTLRILHHAARWPGYWLEPVFACIAGVNLWCGFLLVGSRFTGMRSNTAILAAWCLLTAALYSGAALSPDRVGLAGELLNCAALAGLLLSGSTRGQCDG